MENAPQILEQKILSIAKAVEDQLDEKLQELDKIEVDDLDKLRERRIQQLKKQAAQKQQWLALGHGSYELLGSEKDFFSAVKASERVVCHFFRDNWPCKVLDRHMDVLAQSHLETRFVRIHAEKSPFLTERLKIFMLPTLALVRNAKVEEYVVGFDEFGGSDDFATEDLEDRLIKGKMIFGDSSRPRNLQVKVNLKNLRQSRDGDSDDDDL